MLEPWEMTRADWIDEQRQFRRAATVKATELKVGDIIVSDIYRKEGVFRVEKITDKLKMIRAVCLGRDMQPTDERETLPFFKGVRDYAYNGISDHRFSVDRKEPHEYMVIRDADFATRRYGKTHEKHVREAFERGETIPAAVLGNYEHCDWLVSTASSF